MNEHLKNTYSLIYNLKHLFEMFEQNIYLFIIIFLDVKWVEYIVIILKI